MAVMLTWVEKPGLEVPPRVKHSVTIWKKLTNPPCACGMVPKMQERDLAERADICFLLYWIGSPTSRSPLTGGVTADCSEHGGPLSEGNWFPAHLPACLLRKCQGCHPWGSADPLSNLRRGHRKACRSKSLYHRDHPQSRALHLLSQLSLCLLIESDFSFS